jgi:hypothetical protein
MMEGPADTARAHPFPDLLPPRGPRTLSPAGWVPIDEAVAWIGFASAVPASSWDTELAFGLSLWPWREPDDVLAGLAKRRHEIDLLWRADEHRLGPNTFSFDRTLLLLHRRREEREGAHRQCEDRPAYAGPGDVADLAEVVAQMHAAQRLMNFEAAAMRAEAALCHTAWREIEPGVVSAFHQAALAADALRAALARGETTAYGVQVGPGGKAAADAARRVANAPRVAIPASAFAGPVTLAPDGLYLLLPQDFSVAEEHGAAFVKVVLPASDLKRLFPREAGEWPDLAAEAPRRPGTSGEADGPAAEQHRNPGLVQRTGSPGRPSKSRDLYKREHKRRLESGEAFPTLAEEATHLRNMWLPAVWPGAAVPSLSTVENEIRGEHRKHFGQPRLRDQSRRPK